MTGGEMAVATLVENGVDTLFCLPGIQNDFFFNALYDHNSSSDTPIRPIQTRHEQGAGYMALGYAMATGGIGAFSVVPGPGILNATAALATAYAVNAKVLCLTGQLPTKVIGRELGALHEIENQLEIISSLTKWAARAESAEEVPEVVTRGFEELLSGRPRPVGIEIPMDVLPSTANVTIPSAATGRDDSDVSPAQLDRAAEMLAAAERPMIFVGGGAMGASADVLALAEQLQAPVVSFRSGHGVIDERHPLFMFQPAAKKYWPDCDVAISIGSNMRPMLQGWAKQHMPQLIRIDIDPTTHERIATPEVAITARAEVAVADVLSRIRSISADPAERPDDIERVMSEFISESAVLEPQLSYLSEIRRGMGDDGIFVDELTQVGYVSRVRWRAYHPRTDITCGYQGTLGYGLPTAIGAKVARPDVPVVSISGDGGFMFGVQDLATAVQHRVGVIFVIFDNNAYGNVQMMQKADHGGRVIATQLLNPDFVALAESFGALGVKAETPEAVGNAVAAASGCDLPTVIHAPVGEVPSMESFR